MARKFLGKVIAGAALGGASLLIAPGIAVADGGYDHGRHDHHGKIFAHPKWAKSGHEVTIVEICPEPQEHAWAWSKVTGKLSLAPKDDAESTKDGYGNWHRKQEGEENGSHDKKGKKDSPDTAKGKSDTKPEEGSKQPSDQKYPENKENGENGSHTPGGDESGSKAGKDDKSTAPKQDYKDKNGHSENKAEDDKKGKGHEEGDKRDEHGAPRSDDEDDKWVYATTVTIPWDTKPGRYELKGSCASGTLIVTPKGWVDGGDGGATGTDPMLAAGGAGMLGAAALGGILLVRRRRTDGSLA